MSVLIAVSKDMEHNPDIDLADYLRDQTLKAFGMRNARGRVDTVIERLADDDPEIADQPAVILEAQSFYRCDVSDPWIDFTRGNFGGAR